MKSQEKKFEIFIDKVSSIITDVYVKESDVLDELSPIWGEFPTSFKPWEKSEHDFCLEEQNILFKEFLSSLASDEIRQYWIEQEQLRELMLKVEVA
jgi:hypothetical protein